MNKKTPMRHERIFTIKKGWQSAGCWTVLGILALGISACTGQAVQNRPVVQTKTSPSLSHQTKVGQTKMIQTGGGLVGQMMGRQVDGYDDNHDNHSHEIPREVGTSVDFELWLNSNPAHHHQVNEYQKYLMTQLGGVPLPPMHELLTSARSWQKCGYEPYEVPPRELWSAILPTIRLYHDLRVKGVLPAQTKIRSVYRNPDLNRCAGGAIGSKHMTNGAVDIWVPDYVVGSDELYRLQNKLCEYWLYEGVAYSFGLGLYATGAIHLDTQGHRKWGAQFSESHSICRYNPPKSSSGTP